MSADPPRRAQQVPAGGGAGSEPADAGCAPQGSGLACAAAAPLSHIAGAAVPRGPTPSTNDGRRGWGMRAPVWRDRSAAALPESCCAALLASSARTSRCRVDRRGETTARRRYVETYLGTPTLGDTADGRHEGAIARTATPPLVSGLAADDGGYLPPPPPRRPSPPPPALPNDERGDDDSDSEYLGERDADDAGIEK